MNNEEKEIIFNRAAEYKRVYDAIAERSFENYEKRRAGALRYQAIEQLIAEMGLILEYNQYLAHKEAETSESH